MSSYSATVRVDDDVLHTARPLTAPEAVGDVIDSIVYTVTESAGRLTSVELTFETSDESDTPLADSVTGTSSVPLGGAHADDEEDDEDVAPVPVPAPLS